jgi:hypothetical protein
MKADNPDPTPGSPEWIQQAVPGMQVARAKQKIARKERQAGVTETVADVKSEMARVYRRLAPKIERYRDSFLAGQLYDELENIAELHGAEAEFKRMMNGARNRAHMDYDTNPGGFQNWFWYLPFEEETNEGWKSAVGKAALAGAMALGSGGAHASTSVNDPIWKQLAKQGQQVQVQNNVSRDSFNEKIQTVIGPNTKGEYLVRIVDNNKLKEYVTKTPPQEKMNEESSTSSEAVEIALIRRVLVAHTNLIMEFGLDKVTQAIEEVAYNVGDVDEIGSSDVSGWMNQVKQILGVES